MLVLLFCSLGLNFWLLQDRLLGAFLGVGSTGVSDRGAGGPASGSMTDVSRSALSSLENSTLDRLTQRVASRQQSELSPADLQLLFDSGDFVSAIQGWRILANNNAAAALRIKSQWLTSAEGWLEQQDTELTSLLVEAWLRAFPYDQAFRELQAELLVAQGQRLAAIEQYYALLSESGFGQQGRYANLIAVLVDEEIKSLEEQLAWQPMVRFLEKLLWHEPLHPPYILMLAKANIELENFNEAEILLRNIEYNEFYAERVKQLFEIIALKNLRSIAVPLVKKQSHYLVAGEINDRFAVNLLIDTGASISVLSENYFSRIKNNVNTRFVRMGSINTAGGLVKAPIYQFSAFAIEQYRLVDVQFVVMELDDRSGSDGLLGMNFLQAYDFQIDQQNTLLLLKPR